jgi:beta-glucosidase-like glycosyl hydrolase
LDQDVAGYRQLTGRAPVMPIWAMGLWQCRQRYKTAQESLDVLDGYRSRQIPIDNIVQDWFYWKEDQWGSHELDPERFPDPNRWIRDIHNRYHARLMISVWPKFYPQTENAKEMQSRGFLYQPNLKEQLKDWVGPGYVSTFYDAFNPEARKLFWEQINRELMRRGVDAWWLDATEPDMTPRPTLDALRSHMHPTAMGSGARMLNAYSLMNSQAVYAGQRQAQPDKRVFILTRSAFAGQQRYAAATWSGDISSTWAALRKQIPAGLGFSISGIPWWTTDIGGFSVPPKFARNDPTADAVEEWRELATRWFQFGAFCPLLRVHGEFPNREMWEFGGEYAPGYHAQLKFDRLRYRMLPYVYSLAGAVTHDHATIMRPLVMDFRTDARAQDVADQFMFGPALLVSPVTSYRSRNRAVYLPAGATWYDFWSGVAVEGGRTLDVPAPLDSVPLHVRAGSIIPIGPEIQYTTEKKPDPITLLVYTGADARFTLYEDEGVNYNYEKGAMARIPIQWSEANRTLTIGQRQGAFPGMLKERTFEVVFIDRRRPAGFSFTPAPDRIVKYSGDAVEVNLKDMPIYADPTQPADARIDDLLARLTLEEKISLLHGDSKFTTPAIPRLGIPTRWLSDGPHGVREDIGPDTWRPVGRTDDFSTWLPVAMCLASTFDPELARQYGQVIGTEALKRGKHIMLGPAINIQRTPLCGRNFEYMGEDPYLTSRIAVGYIQGVQSQPVAACAKHFAANNQETQRGTINVEMDDRTLREIYLPAFEAAVKEARVMTVMAAYNKLRGQWCCQNELLLSRILKGEWGFQGLVMSDWAAVHDTRETALNGLDLEMGTEKPYEEYFLARPFREGVASGEYPMSLLDDKVRRNLRVMIATHALDARSAGTMNTSSHQAVARRVAEQGIVLLKNQDKALPLDTEQVRSIAVIGDNAIRKTAHGGGSAEIKALYEITPLEGIISRAGERVNVTFSQGYLPTPPRARGTTQPATTQSAGDLIERAVAAAKAADVAIVTGGLNHSRNQDSEDGDRHDMKLPWSQDELIRRVSQANPRTVVVIKSGAAVEMDQWLDGVPAVLAAWYPGMEGGHALARILFGDVNPSGKLPCTFPRKLADSPAHALYAFPGRDGTVKYEEGLLVGYRWFDTKQIEPQFPFGHGLSYTSFEYSNLKISGAETPTVQFDLANTGAREGAEVAQLYVQDVQSRLTRPLKELKAFRRVVLKPGQKLTVAIPLDRRALAFYDPDSSGWVAEMGEFLIHVGSSSRDIRLRGRYLLPLTSVEK